MTKEQLLRLSGLELFQRQVKMRREGKISLQQVRLTSELWLRHRGYLLTALGWWTAKELAAMGAIQTTNGEWCIGTEERRRVTGRGREQVEQVYDVAAQATAFFARRRLDNAKFGALAATAPVTTTSAEISSVTITSPADETTGDLLAYARDLFGPGKA